MRDTDTATNHITTTQVDGECNTEHIQPNEAAETRLYFPYPNFAAPAPNGCCNN